MKLLKISKCIINITLTFCVLFCFFKMEKTLYIKNNSIVYNMSLNKWVVISSKNGKEFIPVIVNLNGLFYHVVIPEELVYVFDYIPAIFSSSKTSNNTFFGLSSISTSSNTPTETSTEINQEAPQETTRFYPFDDDEF